MSLIDVDSYEVNPIDYRGYQDNKAGFVQSLLSNNFIPYAQEVGREFLGKESQQDNAIGLFSIQDLFNIPGVNQLPSVIFFQQLNKNDATNRFCSYPHNQTTTLPPRQYLYKQKIQ